MDVTSYERERVLVIRRWSAAGEAVIIFHFDESPVNIGISLPEGRWTKQLDSADERWQGPGSQVPGEMVSDGEAALTLAPHAFALFLKGRET